MRYSPESLEAFLQVVECGSFSAAARKLAKSQSTVSVAIANLEADLGVTLFDRQGRNPQLTPRGQRVLPYVKAIFQASEQLDELAIRLSDTVEPRLSFVLSDLWQSSHHEDILQAFSSRYPDIEFECLIAEDEDVIDLLQTGRSQVGIVRVQPYYPPDISSAALQVGTPMGIFCHKQSPLVNKSPLSMDDLNTVRQLALKTYVPNAKLYGHGPRWTSPSLLMLLEMAEQGYGWGILPRWLVTQFGHGVLQELSIVGWPQIFKVDVVWSNKTPPGPAGRWMIDRLREQQPG